MAESKHVAGLLGPTLIALAGSELVGPNIWVNVPATQTDLAGSLWFVAGLAIVRTHNRWAGGWPALVTGMGWFAMLGGLFRMFAPEFAQQNVPNATLLRIIQILLLTIGAYLTFKARGGREGDLELDPR